MSKLLKKYWIALCFGVVTVFISLLATWTKEVITISPLFEKVATVLVYMPFIAAVLWKLMCDLKNFKTSIQRPINMVYYGFAFYYVCISAYRFFISAEVKENLYYSIIFFGSIAIYMQLADRKISIEKEQLQKNIILISAMMAIARLVNYFLVGPIFASYPINMNIMTGLNIITIPFLVDCHKNLSCKKYKIITLVLIAIILLEVLTSSARLMCTLVLVALFVQIIANFKNKKVFKRVLIACVCALLVITTMFVANVKNTRYAIYREFKFVKTIVMVIDEAMGTHMSGNKLDEEQEMVEAIEQIQRSDSMRNDLMKMGIDEISKNPLIGTGNVTFLYPVGEYEFQQSSHNFLLETLNCYGVIGLLFIIAFIVVALYNSKVFSRKNKGPWQNKASVLLTFAIFFAMGSLQPLVFNILLCPVFMMLFANFDMIAKENLEIKE